VDVGRERHDLVRDDGAHCAADLLVLVGGLEQLHVSPHVGLRPGRADRPAPLLGAYDHVPISITARPPCLPYGDGNAEPRYGHAAPVAKRLIPSNFKTSGNPTKEMTWHRLRLTSRTISPRRQRPNRRKRPLSSTTPKSIIERWIR